MKNMDLEVIPFVHYLSNAATLHTSIPLVLPSSFLAIFPSIGLLTTLYGILICSLFESLFYKKKLLNIEMSTQSRFSRLMGDTT